MCDEPTIFPYFYFRFPTKARITKGQWLNVYPSYLVYNHI
jgi:hypothetical protein